MAQITWRNVNSAGIADATRALDSSQRSFDSMFDRLASVVGRSQAIEDKNWDTGKTNRTNERLNTIMNFATPEEFAAAQQSGALRGLLEGGQIDQQAIRTALDSRLPLLQQRAKGNIDYRNTMIDDKTAPLMEAARIAALNGQFDEAQNILGQYTQTGGRKGSSIAELIDARQYTGIERQYAREDQDMQMDAARDALKTNASQRAANAAQARAATASAGLAARRLGLDERRVALAEGQAEFEQNVTALEKARNARSKNNVFADGTVDTAENQVKLNTHIDKMSGGDQKVASALRQGLAEMSSNGFTYPSTDANGREVKKRISVPVSVMINALNNTKDMRNFIGKWSGNNATEIRDQIVKNVNREMNSAKVIDAAEEHAAIEASSSKRFLELVKKRKNTKPVPANIVLDPDEDR